MKVFTSGYQPSLSGIGAHVYNQLTKTRKTSTVHVSQFSNGGRMAVYFWCRIEAHAILIGRRNIYPTPYQSGTHITTLGTMSDFVHILVRDEVVSVPELLKPWSILSRNEDILFSIWHVTDRKGFGRGWTFLLCYCRYWIAVCLTSILMDESMTFIWTSSYIQASLLLQYLAVDKKKAGLIRREPQVCLQYSTFKNL